MVEEPLNVLVVEDNRGDVRLIKNGFEESSVARSLTVVNDGEAALDYLYRRNGYESEAKPDLVLLDLNVPKKTGRDVLEQIGAEPDLRSIPLLGLAGREPHSRDLRVGCGRLLRQTRRPARVHLARRTGREFGSLLGNAPPGRVLRDRPQDVSGRREQLLRSRRARIPYFDTDRKTE